MGSRSAGAAALKAIAVVFLLLGVARAEPRIKPEARAHLDRGLKLYERQRYDDAIAELRAGLAIDPQPDLLYALGQAERRRGNCERAIEYYRSCLALVKDAASVAAVRVQIERCHVTAASEAKPSPPTEQPTEEPTPKESAALPEPATPPPTPPPATPPPAIPPPSLAPPPAVAAPAKAKPAPWYRDGLGWALTAVGVAGLGGGGALVAVADDRANHASDSYQAYADARVAPSLWTGGIVGLAVGGALVAGAVVRFAVVAHRRAEPR